MIKIQESSLYKSEQATGTIFGDMAAKKLSQKGTQTAEVAELEANDLLIFPQKLTFGWNKRFGGFAMVHLLKGGKKNDAVVYRLFPGTIKRTLFEVQQDEETGKWERTGNRPRNSGSAIELVNKFGDYKSAFEDLQGKCIKVTSVAPVTVLRFGSKDETQERNQMVLDVVAVPSGCEEFTEPEKKNG